MEKCDVESIVLALMAFLAHNKFDVKNLVVIDKDLSSSSFGVHPLRITTSFSSTLKVGFAVAEEANASVALSTTKWALIIRIRNWAEHWSMLMSTTASESCSTIVFIVKV